MKARFGIIALAAATALTGINSWLYGLPRLDGMSKIQRLMRSADEQYEVGYKRGFADCQRRQTPEGLQDDGKTN